MPANFTGESYLDAATTDHERDHGRFPEHKTQARLFAFLTFSRFDHLSLT